MASQCMRGNGYIRILDLGRDGYPSSIEAIHPDAVRPDRRNGTDIAEVSNDSGGHDTLVKWTPRRRDGEYLHLRWWSDTAPVSPSPIEAHARTIATHIRQREYLARIWNPGPTSGGILTGDTNQIGAEHLQRLEAWLAERALRPDVGGTPPVLPGSLKWVPLSLSPADAEILEMLRLGSLDVSRIYRIPPHLLATQDLSTWGAGIRSMNEFFRTITLRPWASRLNLALSHIQPPGDYARLDLDHLTDGTLAERFAAWRIGIESGQVTVNESRIAEDRPKVPGGDKISLPTKLRDAG